VIVNWNGRDHLRDCLPALAQQTLPDHEVIVVDNGSRDGSVAWLRAAHPGVRVVALDTNLGFARGNNLGMHLARAPFVVALNNDTIPAPTFLAELLRPFGQSDDIGMVAGVLVFAHRPTLVASAGIAVQRNGLALDLWAGRAVARLPGEPLEIFGPSGGAAAYRRELLDDVGLFAPSFWMYLEDADLAWRARLRGWRCLLAPAARVQHVYSASSGQGSPLKQRLLARNRLRLLLRCLPRAQLLRWLPAIVGYDLLAAGYGLLRGQPQLAAGRIDGLGGLAELLRQRRAIQRRRTVATAALAGWATPAEWPWAQLRAQAALRGLLER
jgi:GT2 family glycosyltransferase